MKRTGLTGNGFLSSKRISTLSYFGVALAIAVLLSFHSPMEGQGKGGITRVDRQTTELGLLLLASWPLAASGCAVTTLLFDPLQSKHGLLGVL